ncbi:MAG: DUF1853 family protein [Motiliproteus sp.]
MRHGAGAYPARSPFAPRSRQRVPLHHACVRDLAWCLSSPAIYRLGHPNNNLLGDSKHLWQWLRRLDQQPQPLLDAIAQQRSHRLGIYFETLLEFTLAHHVKPARHFYALAVRQQGRTLGEYDFLFRRRGEAALHHLEVSIKFYLGLPRAQSSTHWVGLNRNDRLVDKVDKMQQRQLRLSHLPAARQQLQALGEQVGPCHGLILGRLFYPLEKPTTSPPQGALPGHLRGWWLRHSDQRKITTQAQYSGVLASPTLLVSLQRQQWLAPLAPAEAQQLASEALAAHADSAPGMVARLILTPLGWREHDRGVLAADAWLDSVLKTLE